ncbi:MAG: hypothetical protein AAGA48_04480 [Myxococcota bacterium]
MSVRVTESRLPAGFEPGDLGEADVHPGNGAPPQFALISTLSGPLPVGYYVDYFVFVVDSAYSAANLTYDFRVTLPNGTIQSTTTEGVFSQPDSFGFKAEGLLIETQGTHLIRVEILDGQTVLATLSLQQEAVAAPLPLQSLFYDGSRPTRRSSIGAIAGDAEVAKEFVRGLLPFVESAAISDATDVPPRLLGAVIFNNLSRASAEGWRGRRSKLRLAAQELNGESAWYDPQSERLQRLGIAQISIPVLAMITGPNPNDPNSTYTSWVEIQTGNEWHRTRASTARETRRTNLDNLANAADVRIDLFNLLRFPKTAARMAARYLDRLVRRPVRLSAPSQALILQDDELMIALASEYRDTPEAAATADVKTNTFGASTVSKKMGLPVLQACFPEELPGAADYGGHLLQWGDTDNFPGTGQAQYGGAPHPGGSNHIATLRQHLSTLGFGIIEPDATGNNPESFDHLAEWAVREFQIYAKMPFVAHEAAGAGRYVTRLSSQENLMIYLGPVSGKLNTATRVILHHWLANDWRCPVVIEPSTGVSVNLNSYPSFTPLNAPTHTPDNLWNPHLYPAAWAVDSPTPAIDISIFERFGRVLDLSGYYDIPAVRLTEEAGDPNQMKLIHCAYWFEGTSPNVDFGGPTSAYKEAWRGTDAGATEVLPMGLFGENEAALMGNPGNSGDPAPGKEARHSTFKVVRVLSEVENLGFFDSVNTWDTAYLSLGLCHWTLGRPHTQNVNYERAGELGGFLAYLKQFAPDTFADACQFFGLDVEFSWINRDDGLVTGRDLFSPEHRKYVNWVTLSQEDWSNRPIYGGNYGTAANSTRTYNNVVTAENREGAHFYFRTYHWVYRFQMAARTMPLFNQQMWDMARIRLRDLLSTPWGVPSVGDEQIESTGDNLIPGNPPTNSGKLNRTTGAERDITIGDVFTSERAVALLFRIHVNQPSLIIDYNNNTATAGQLARTAYEHAKDADGSLVWDDRFGSWNDDNQMRLISGITNKVDALSNTFNDLKQSINFVENFPPNTPAEQYGFYRGPRGYVLSIDTLIGPKPAGSPLSDIEFQKQKFLRAGKDTFTLDLSDLPTPPFPTPPYEP